jgi:dTDP-4-dehydrorhamnose reductase
MKIKVLVIGSTGLLGNMVFKYLTTVSNISLYENKFRWPSQEFKNYISSNKFDYIINCIGAIHQRTNEFSVNYDLPIWLDTLGVRIVHPGTDCEMDDDDYGISKYKAKKFIVSESKNTKIIKTSIIGPELKSKFSLMNWFLSNDDNLSVNGYVNHYWNGNTTLTWAKFCLNLISDWDRYDKETILFSNCVSKYDLLNFINETFCRNIVVNPFESPKSVNKCLDGQIRTENIKNQLLELKEFIQDNNNNNNNNNKYLKLPFDFKLEIGLKLLKY